VGLHELIRRLRYEVGRLRGADGRNRLRRPLEQRVDQAWTMARSRLEHARPVVPFDGDPRFAVLTVNFSTTRYLKLMLLTLTARAPSPTCIESSLSTTDHATVGCRSSGR
jgi:hypothetical protein